MEKEEVTWSIGGETVSSRKPLAYREPVEIIEKMSKGQAAFAQGYNEMRERLLELGEMKSK